MKSALGEQSASARVRYIWGAAVIWTAIWIGTAVVLRGGGTFADMIPILAVGTGWFIAVVPGQLAALDDTTPRSAKKRHGGAGAAPP